MPAGQERLPGRAPGRLVGNLIHRVLAEWEPLHRPQPLLERRLRAIAHREGILRPQAVDHAVARSLRMLGSLQQTALFREIERAAQRLGEVPFSLTAGQRRLHGVIDLLFQDHHGTWYLVDWKTEWTTRDQLEEQVQAHLPQLAVYTMAVERLLGTRPYAYLCFLSLGAATRRFAPTELTPIWERFIASQAHA
jgi:ATP-dependent exoDNAse (exonuclease V) beta subunit